MPRKPINFELDFMIKDIFPRFTVKQFDDVSFNIKPKNQGLDYDTTGMMGKIFVGVNNDMFMQTDGISVSSNNINVLLDKNMLQKNGRAYAEIELTDKAGTITSSSFIFDIDPKIGEGGMIPGEYEGFVEKYERLIAEFKSQVNSSVNSANSLVNDVIKKCNTNVDNKLNTVDGLINAKISDIEKRFNNITTSKQQDAEVIDARDGEVSLKARLDRDIEKAKQVYVDVEGSHISTDSSSGYAKDIEILGNTIQDASNLADIRSVGDTVEGQELYEIPVLSCGKNLFNTKKAVSTTGVSGISVVATNSDMILTTTSGAYNMLPINYNLKPNTKYILKGNHTVLNGNGRPYCEVRDINGVLLGSNGWKLPVQFTTDNTGFVKILFGCNDNENNASISYYNIQLEEGTVATPYEPYVEDKLTILSPVQLEKVGDVRDRIIEKDGVWGVEKNIVTDILDNTFTYNMYTANHNTDVLIINKKEYHATFHYDAMKKAIFLQGYKSGVEDNQDIDSTYFIGRVYQNPGNIGVVFTKHTTIENAKSQVLGKKLYLRYAQPQFIPLPHDQQVKLRTFAGQTNIHFETEIQGTIKAQVPKSLGATVNSHTEQISNLNKELDRVKKLEESTVSTVTTESDFTIVEQTSNGYFEDVKLEGKTLVNLCKKTSHTVIGQEANNWDKHIELTRPLVVGNKYTLIVNVKTYTLDKGYSIFGRTALGSGGEAQYSLLDNITKSGIHKNVFTAQKAITMLSIADENNSTSGESLIEDFILLEGDHTQNPPSYFEGLMSVGQDVEDVSVESINENLLNLADLGCTMVGQFVTIEHIDTNSIKLNTLSTNTNPYASVGFDTFKFIPNVKYRIKAKCTHSDSTNTPFISIRKYKNNNSALIDIDVTNGAIEATFVPTHTKHRIELFTGNHRGSLGGTWVEFTDIQISIDNDDFSYFTPYQSDKKPLLYYNEETQTWEKPILRQWDSIEKHSDGKYYYHKRSGEVVLNGSESWTNYDSLGACTPYLVEIPKINYNHAPISDKFVGGIFDGRDEEKICVGGSPHIIIQKANSTLSTQNVAGFKQWLQANNVTVVYQLAEEKVYECTNLDLITYEGETNYIVNCGAISPKSILKVHNNISNVVKILQEKVSLLESNVKASQEVQDMMILETDMRILDIELALMEHMPITLNLGENTMLRSATYFNFLKNHIINETYEKEYLENVMNKYLATGRINQDEYNELYKMLYPPVYDIELPIEE